jgi:N-acetylneuraminate lyase
MNCRLVGLVAATHSPFHADGSLNLAVVENQAVHLTANSVAYAFIGGTTGECSSLTFEERHALTARWIEVTRGSELKVIVHVGSNCLADARALAAQAQELGAYAISAHPPCYFKPAGVVALVESMADIAAAAPLIPFYYYEIPSLTGVTFSPSEFLKQAADRIANLAGIKFASSNMMEYQFCRSFQNGAFDIPFGIDEMLLAALALGAGGAVGSTYNFAAPIYRRLIAAFRNGDFATANMEQFRSLRLVQTLASRGYMGSTKALMGMLGVAVGPARLPNSTLTSEQTNALQRELQELGAFDWFRA